MIDVILDYLNSKIDGLIIIDRDSNIVHLRCGSIRCIVITDVGSFITIYSYNSIYNVYKNRMIMYYCDESFLDDLYYVVVRRLL